jgi:hypothetical protein
VEFVPELLRELRAETAGGPQRGFLYGLRIANEVRVLAARLRPDPADARLAGLGMVGIYVWRARGEVFLTDADIEFMDREQAALALVVAGPRAGFFAREADGTLQAVRSHEEFAVLEAVVQTDFAAPCPPEPVRLVRHPALAPPHPARWMVILLGLVGPAAALAYFRPLLPNPPLEMNVREVAGQLVIAWNPRAVGRGGRLEIEEKGARRTIELARGSAGATYAIGGGDVEIRLATEKGAGSARWTAARFSPRTAPEARQSAEALRQQVRALEREARDLRRAIAAQSVRIEDLTRRAGAMIAR